jgi:dinuclear metal center YbgI/SA1388 family protein
MKIQDVINYLEGWAPLAYQEPYDNAGLLVGDVNSEVAGVLVCLDSTEAVIEEAKKKNCNLIVAHHPIIFSGLKSITGGTYIERALIKAIKNDIAIYAIHTNLDNVLTGVNKEISDRLGLENQTILSPKKSLFTKLSVFTPIEKAEQVRQAIFDAGAGKIGAYENCSFNMDGSGTFKPINEANPHIGEVGKVHEEPEVRIEVLVPNAGLGKVVSAMLDSHPYEQVAYDLVSLQNENQFVGSGMVGELVNSEDLMDFLKRVKDTFNSGIVRYTAPIGNNKIKKVAVCGGAGSFLLNAAVGVNADIFITADHKYHQFFDADNRIVIADIGHFESEQFTIDCIRRKLMEKFTTFAVHFTEVNTNPINYL